MDDRVTTLGHQAALDRPAWALRYLGDIPADPTERADWTHRAGLAAAYREERGYTHDTEAMGPAPDHGSPEQRTSWQIACTALCLPDEDRNIATVGDGDLWSWRNTYTRDTAWAPPYVTGELRAAHLAEDAYRAEAAHTWHQADATADPAERTRLQQDAEQASILVQEVGAYRESLTEIADARRHWHKATEPTRQRALRADAELRRRHPDADLPPLHTPAEPDRAEDTMPSGTHEPAAHPATPPNPAHSQPSARRDIAAALATARRAEQILSERHAAEADTGDVMRRREAAAQHEAAARRDAVRQDPAPSRRAPVLERDEPELEAG